MDTLSPRVEEKVAASSKEAKKFLGEEQGSKADNTPPITSKPVTTVG